MVASIDTVSDCDSQSVCRNFYKFSKFNFSGFQPPNLLNFFYGSVCVSSMWLIPCHVPHVHMSTCTRGTWHVVTHVEETYTESHKKIWVDLVNGSHRNCTLKLLLSCSWTKGQRLGRGDKNPKRLVERVRLAEHSLKSLTSSFSMSAPLGALVLLVASDVSVYVCLSPC